MLLIRVIPLIPSAPTCYRLRQSAVQCVPAQMDTRRRGCTHFSLPVAETVTTRCSHGLRLNPVHLTLFARMSPVTTHHLTCAISTAWCTRTFIGAKRGLSNWLFFDIFASMRFLHMIALHLHYWRTGYPVLVPRRFVDFVHLMGV